MERCKNPGDWLRREIETAIDEKRNIVPLMLEGFDFGSPLIKEALTGKLAALYGINALPIPDAYALEAMERLRNRFLNIALSDVHLPTLQAEAQTITETQKTAASEAAPVEEEQLTAQTWFEKGYVFQEAKNLEEAIRCYSEALRLDPNLDVAQNNLGVLFSDLKRYDEAEAAYRKAIELNPSDDTAHVNLGQLYFDQGKWQEAITVLAEAIHFNPKSAWCYRQRGLFHQTMGNLESALDDYRQTIRLQPDYGLVRMSLFGLLKKMGKNDEASEHELLAREFAKTDSEYNRACFESLCGNMEEALDLLKIAFEKGESSKEWARQDPDLENVCNDPRFKELVGE